MDRDQGFSRKISDRVYQTTCSEENVPHASGSWLRTAENPDLGTRGTAGAGRFVVSHPCAGKKAQGWGARLSRSCLLSIITNIETQDVSVCIKLILIGATRSIPKPNLQFTRCVAMLLQCRCEWIE